MHPFNGRHAVYSLLGLPVLPLPADEPKLVVPAYNTMTDEQKIFLSQETAKGIEKDMESVPADGNLLTASGASKATQGQFSKLPPPPKRPRATNENET